MILDHLSNHRRYHLLHPRFFLAFEFLSKTDLMNLPDGRVSILGNEIYASVAHAQGKGAENVRLEAHRQYIDIQYIITGQDLMGWRNIASCSLQREPYQQEQDIIFFNDPTETSFIVPSHHFVLFFPEDTHAPLAGFGPVFKIVVKVAISSVAEYW